TAADRNVISGNGVCGVFLYTSAATGNTVAGNYVGTDASGAHAIGNATIGISMDGAPGNTIGGISPAARNVVAANGRDGILVIHAGSTLNVVQNNYVGVNAAGDAALGNAWYGIEVSQPNNVIGGAYVGNVVSANVHGGIALYLASSTGNRVQGNLVGTDA